MRVFVAGSSGAIGRPLVRALLDRGHHAIAMVRSDRPLAEMERIGAEPVVADALNRQAVVAAVRDAKPDVVVHQLTALTGVRNGRRFDAEYAATNRLRTEGTDHLLEAASRAGVGRFVAQSYAGFYPRAGAWVKSEEVPLGAAPAKWQRETVAALHHLERRTLSTRGIDGIVLRYGNLYGPGTAIAPDGDLVALVRARKLPLIGSGDGVWSFVHVDDAAHATVLAIESGTAGVYNVADDEPARVAEWLPALAAAAGAPAPARIPAWLARLVAGPVAVSMMTEARGAANGKAKRDLGWQLAHPSWRVGFERVLATGT